MPEYSRWVDSASIRFIAGICLIGLYNFSSTRFPLIPGKKLIAATFYELDQDELNGFPAPETLDDFPDELLQVMQKYQPLAIQSVEKDVQRVRDELQALKADFQSRSVWYERFEIALDRHDKQIADLLKGLDTEVATRNRGEDQLSRALGKIERTLNWLQGIAAAIGFLVAVIGIPLLISWISAHWLTH